MRFKQNLWVFIGVLYSLALIYLLLFAGFREDSSIEPNLIPLAALSEDFYFILVYPSSWAWKFFLINGIIANFLLFFPVPFFFNLRVKGFLKWTMIIGIPIIIEYLQFAFSVGQADIDDVMLNAMGFALGFHLHRKNWFRRFLPKSE